MDEKELEKMIADAIESKLKGEYMKGAKVGWLAALLSFKQRTKDLHNADKIKKELNAMIAEAKDRNNRNKSEPTP